MEVLNRNTVLAACLLVLVVPGAICLWLVLSAFAGFSGRSEFTKLPGPAAQRRLADWPEGVAARDVQVLSYKFEWERDGNSAWYRIELPAAAAATWADSVHRQQEVDAHTCLHELHQGLEGVHHQVPGPPPLHWQTGDTPSWWTPPSIEFRATEVMLWYTNYDSGVGRAVYSAFDDSTDTMWIYDYSSQHDLFWEPGRLPPGEVFSTIER